MAKRTVIVIAKKGMTLFGKQYAKGETLEMDGSTLQYALRFGLVAQAPSAPEGGKTPDTQPAPDSTTAPGPSAPEGGQAPDAPAASDFAPAKPKKTSK
ncbi:MAG: hypothetical protein LBG65_07575 [Puniceicoccales bacterium]|jgi:hypothetical protein|nr:hypothetical protein [Puniceicoccales bacterium]